MTTLVLALITLVAAVTLTGVLWSLGRVLLAESTGSRLRREGVPATGTVVDNTMTSTAQRRLLFSPVVEFQSLSGQHVSAPARQQAASSWARGTTVQVCYDPTDPSRFVLAGPPARNQVVANVLVGALVIVILAGTIVAMFHVWEQFHYEQGDRPGTGGSSRSPVESRG